NPSTPTPPSFKKQSPPKTSVSVTNTGSLPSSPAQKAHNQAVKALNSRFQPRDCVFDKPKVKFWDMAHKFQAIDIWLYESGFLAGFSACKDTPRFGVWVASFDPAPFQKFIDVSFHFDSRYSLFEEFLFFVLNIRKPFRIGWPHTLWI